MEPKQANDNSSDRGPDQNSPFGMSAQDLANVARIIRLATKLGARHERERSYNPTFACVARAIYQMRRLRFSFLNEQLFGEPVWDMLLLLYSQDAKHRPLVAKDLALGCGAPATTALRWQSVMADRGLISRTPHPTDARATEIKLTDKARQLLDDYFTTLAVSGFS